ncbi:hypothetical protein PR048_008280 [Dryococelus australis]|uniref:Uncharacterized protein n=1 Tax=Dryococelus australis TaxID=614101 RepID=A0ABQ9HYB6_9NEOP|nr:hypothetical protein PR048_008280 [Dryococelus australis]
MQRRGKREIPDKIPPTSFIVRHDSHLQGIRECRLGDASRSHGCVAVQPQRALQFNQRPLGSISASTINGQTLAWSGAEIKWRGKREDPEKTHLQAASSSTIPTCEDPGANPDRLEPMRVKRGEYGPASECKGDGNGRSPRKPADQKHCPERFPRAKIRERTPLGIKPGSPRWEASS